MAKLERVAAVGSAREGNAPLAVSAGRDAAGGLGAAVPKG